MMDDTAFSEFLDESIPLWRDDPVMFFREVLNFEPDEWQAQAARDLAANPKVSIKSGQGVGKTGLEAAVFLWFVTCFPHPRIVATAPTKQQLHDVLWSEISKWMSKSELLSILLKWTKKENPALCTMRLPNGLQCCIRMRKRTPRIIFLYLFRKMENGK